MIRINVWKNIKHKDRLMVLYDFQNVSAESPTTQRDWVLWMHFDAFNPLQRPFPTQTELFRAIHSPIYPYEFKEFVKEEYLFNQLINQNGTFVVAYDRSGVDRSLLPLKSDTPIYVENLKVIKPF
jgi:hypothetical protein